MTGMTVWFTGLSSAGKTTISQAVHHSLTARGYRVEWLDGDAVRQHISKGLGYSKEDRDENVRRIGFVAELLTRNGVIVLVSAISPYRAVRDEIRLRIGNFLEVYVDAALEVCQKRDVNGVYRRAQTGEIHHVTGLDDPYEPPLAPGVVCHTDRETPDESVQKVLDRVRSWIAHGSQLQWDSMKARVYVSMKPTVLDPQGQTIRSALAGLGHTSIAAVRQGKYFEITLEPGTDRVKAGAEIEQIAHEVLANPVIEEYRVEFVE